MVEGGQKEIEHKKWGREESKRRNEKGGEIWRGKSIEWGREEREGG